MILSHSRGIILNRVEDFNFVNSKGMYDLARVRNQSDLVRPENSWIIAPVTFERSLKTNENLKQKSVSKDKRISRKKAHKKGDKCINEVFQKLKNRRAGGKRKKLLKYVMPIFLGLLAAKTILVPVALKVLAFISAKGLMLGMISTIMATILSLKGILHPYARSEGKGDGQTQVEVIHVPSQHTKYFDDARFQL